MTIAQFEAAQWVMFFTFAAVVYVFQIPGFVCKRRWAERYEKRLRDRQYNFYWHLPWYVYNILFLVALIASALANGFIWSDVLETTVADPAESNSLFLGAMILTAISYAAILFWTYLFMGQSFPVLKVHTPKQKDHICVWFIDWAFALLTIAFVAALLACIFFWIETSMGWVSLFYPVFLLIIWIFNLLIVLNEHNWDDSEH